MFNVGDKVRRISHVDLTGNRPSNGKVWEVYCVEHDKSDGSTYLGFALDPEEPNKATWDAACFELVEQYSPNEAKPPEVVALGDKLSLTDWADKQYQIWCDTCEGSGEIDETLGSIAPYGDPHAKCPDCGGKGFWLKSFETKPAKEKVVNKYSREIKPSVFVDVYDVLRAFEVNDPCLSHLAKKALCAGLRGHKDRLEDLLDIKASIERAIYMHKEWNTDGGI